MIKRDKIYFASDFHLGAYPEEASKLRELRIVSWMDHIQDDAKAVYLMGDVFDFWFEYSTVVPKGYIRFLGKLAQLADSGIEIIFFKGNHDMWMSDYFVEELGAKIVNHEMILKMDNKSFYLHHGDGLGDGDRKYKLLKKIFRNKTCQWLFARLHPNLGIGIANRWSKHSRVSSEGLERFQGNENEWLIQFVLEAEKQQHHDYYLFGHRHIPYDIQVNDDTTVMNLGEWIHYDTYAVWDGTQLKLNKWEYPRPVKYHTPSTTSSCDIEEQSNTE